MLTGCLEKDYVNCVVFANFDQVGSSRAAAHRRMTFDLLQRLVSNDSRRQFVPEQGPAGAVCSRGACSSTCPYNGGHTPADRVFLLTNISSDLHSILQRGRKDNLVKRTRAREKRTLTMVKFPEGCAVRAVLRSDCSWGAKAEWGKVQKDQCFRGYS